jgi:hypothetical protein
MTGFALLFIAASWIVSRRILGVALLIGVASLIKMFDAFLLGYPILHGAIANPIFAFITEGAAFVVVVILIKERLTQRGLGQAFMGGMAALMAANMFPLVKFATGIPACVVPGTVFPLSLYHIHYAVLLSLVTVPAGFWIGSQIGTVAARIPDSRAVKRLNQVLSPAILLGCLIIVALIRLI